MVGVAQSQRDAPPVVDKLDGHFAVQQEGPRAITYWVRRWAVSPDRSASSERADARPERGDRVSGVRAMRDGDWDIVAGQAFEKWRRTSKRLTLYETHILERTQAAAKAAEKSYATGSSSYDDMIRIFLGELDVRLKIEELKMITAQAQADLAYFNGEIQ